MNLAQACAVKLAHAPLSGLNCWLTSLIGSLGNGMSLHNHWTPLKQTLVFCPGWVEQDFKEHITAREKTYLYTGLKGMLCFILLTIESAILNKKPTQHYPAVVTPLELYQTQLFTYVYYTTYNYRGLISLRSALFWLTRALLWSAIEGQQGF